jgi:hypothetical protein
VTGTTRAMHCLLPQVAQRIRLTTSLASQPQMLAMIEWASERPKGWHDIGKLPEFRSAAELLAKRDVIEIRQPMNQYRLKKPKP